MQSYGARAGSWPQKALILAGELGLVALSYDLLFGQWGRSFARWMGWPAGDGIERAIVFAFSVIVFARMSFMMLVLLRRRMPLEEAVSVPLAFAVYYLGFALLALRSNHPLGLPAAIGVVVFAAGSLLDTISEVQRHLWKLRPENSGRLSRAGCSPGRCTSTISATSCG
jgi:hypothetical protein